MEPNIYANITPQNPNPATTMPLISGMCSVCHQPLLSQYYFCPNCGTKVNATALSTSVGAQTWIYIFSAALPWMCYLFITKWQGIKYLKSEDQKTKTIGVIACGILALSTIITIWLAVVWTQDFIKSQLNDINTDFSAENGF